MLKNMKVKTSMMLGYFITIIVSVIIIVVALLMLNQTNNAYQDIIGSHVESNLQITVARLNSNLAARDIRDMLLMPTDPNNAKVEQNISGWLTAMDNALEVLQEKYPMDKSNLTEYLNAVSTWRNGYDNVLSMYQRGEYDQAIETLMSTGNENLEAMTSLAAVVDNGLTTAQNEEVAAQERTTTTTMIILIVVMAVATVAVIVLALYLVRSITGPVEDVRQTLAGFSQGKFDVPVNYESKNELGEMCEALRSSQDTLSKVINEESYLLGEMAKGNFNLAIKDDSLYVGDLDAVKMAIRTINRNLSDTLSQINLSAEQVNAGSDQVSTGAQSLAQGATEQASAVQELSATIQEIANKSIKNAKSCDTAMHQMETASAAVDESNRYMEEMVQAMDKISRSSEEIGKIIATIENIAFQTNILALNAAVEAARAGSAGKGFAVVADEVRNLSAKSDQAAKATKELIDNSVASVQEGTAIVKKVSEALEKTVVASGEVQESVSEIAKAVEEESEAIAQVTEGIDQISSVVQTNSATSEQSAAASEELSSQATIMKNLMAKFKLRDSDDSAISMPAAGSYSAPAHSAAGSNSFSKY